MSGTVWGVEATGYEIRHGRVDRDDALTQSGDVLGTSWHGLLEGDAFRRKLLTWVAERRGRDWTPGTTSFAAVREAHLDRLADWFGEHVDAHALIDLIATWCPRKAAGDRLLRLLTTADTEILATAHAVRAARPGLPGGARGEPGR